MSNQLLDVWEAASASPFHPYIAKDNEFVLGFSLLVFCMLCYHCRDPHTTRRALTTHPQLCSLAASSA